MYSIFAASVLLSFLGLLSFVLVLLLGLPSWLWCLVRCGSWGSLVIRHEIGINSNSPGVLSGFSWLLGNCARLAVFVLLSQDLTGLQAYRLTGLQAYRLTGLQGDGVTVSGYKPGRGDWLTTCTTSTR